MKRNEHGTLRKDGYRLITINGKRVFEHRYIMEQFLNRKLTFNETIHHKNYNREDNRIENLELIDRKEHSHLYNKNSNFFLICLYCGKNFKCYKAHKRAGFCCHKCWYLFRKQKHIHSGTQYKDN